MWSPRGGGTNIDGPLGRSLRLFATFPLFFGEEGFDIFTLSLQGAAVFQETIVVSVRIKGFKNIVCDTAHHGIDLQPVVECLVLMFVEVLQLFVAHGFQLRRR